MCVALLSVASKIYSADSLETHIFSFYIKVHLFLVIKILSDPVTLHQRVTADNKEIYRYFQKYIL